MNQYSIHRVYSLAAFVAVTIIFISLFAFSSFAEATSLPPNNDCVYITKELRFGKRDSNTNGEVTKLQDFLIDFEYLDSEATGRFGTKTRSALKLFQSEQGLTQTGVTNADTRNHIYGVSCDSSETNLPIPNTNTATTTTNTTNTGTTNSGNTTETTTVTNATNSGPIRCNSATVTWLDDSSITVMRNGSPTLLSCTASLSSGPEDRSVTITAQNGGQSSGSYWVNGYGSATFNCVKENGEYKWKTSAGLKKCSLTPVNTTTQTTTSNTQSGSANTSNTSTTQSGSTGSQSNTTTSTTNSQSGTTNTTNTQTNTCDMPNTSLELGDGAENNKAAQVTLLQKFLISRGFLVYAPGPTGYYGVLTQNAVKSFQLATGITQTGAVFEVTLAKIRSMCTGGTGVSNTGTGSTGTSQSTGSTGGSQSTGTTNTSSGTAVGTAVVTYTSSTGNVISTGTQSAGSESCVIAVGDSSCAITASWTTTNAKSLTYRKIGTTVDLSTSLNGSYKIEGQKPGSAATYVLTLMPGSVTYSKAISAQCAAGSTWNGSKCENSGTGPTATLTTSPSYTSTYPTQLTHTLSSTNARSCEVKTQGGATHVRWDENATSKTVVDTPIPGNYILVSQCATGYKGLGTKSPETITNVVVTCPPGTTWRASFCGATNENNTYNPTSNQTSAAAPSATLTISPASTVTYPTNVVYTLSSSNAKSCRVVSSDGVTHVDWTENAIGKTVQAVTPPGTLTLTYECASGINGTGTRTGAQTKTITVACPVGAGWTGSSCVIPTTSTPTTPPVVTPPVVVPPVVVAPAAPYVSLLVMENPNVSTIGSWTGRSGVLSITASGSGLTSCALTVDGVPGFARTFPANGSVNVYEQYLVGFTGTAPYGYFPMSADEYNLFKGKTYRLTCSANGVDTVSTSRF